MNDSWQWFVGARYLRARTHNRFVSFISSISILGVALGVAVLIVVLSVMNGFETELRTRILWHDRACVAGKLRRRAGELGGGPCGIVERRCRRPRRGALHPGRGHAVAQGRR
jgi:hypothetical protein